MRKRTLLTIVLVGLMLMVSLLVLLVIIIVRGRTEPMDDLVAPEEVTVKKEVIIDRYAGRELDAIAMVQQFQVLDPEYVLKMYEREKKKQEAEAAEAAAEPKGKKGKRSRGKEDKQAAPEEVAAEEEELVPTTVTLQELVSRKYLEERFKMSFLERGNWRSLQLETDLPNQPSDDPYYEVYLEYHDEEVTVGPVWVVNVATGEVVPRNEMAEFFEIKLETAEAAEESLSRPARVVKAITNHRFPSGIELGGVLLLHFVNRPEKLRDKDDRIVGWTVAHDFGNDYNAYFQWIEGKEPRVARFRFDWKEQRLEPRGLVAIDLMSEGEGRKSDTSAQISIWPTTYDNRTDIPRAARWKGKKHPCQKQDNRDRCDAFAMVLEQQDFIEAVQWLMTEEGSAKQFETCVEMRNCKWIPKPSGEGKSTFTIHYQYQIGGAEKKMGFQVDPKNESIIPVDDISRWAYWSVTPRT